MKLIGLIQNGKGTIYEADQLFPAAGSIEVIKELDNGVNVVEVSLGDVKTEPKVRKQYKKREKADKAPSPPAE